MIAHTLPILAVAVALGVRAIPTPAPQGVTTLITPGRVLNSCIINYPGVYGISIRGVGSSTASSVAALAGAVAAGSGVARGAEGAVSAASAAAAEGAVEKLRRRQSVTRISDGRFHVVPVLETRAPEIPASEIFTLEKAAGLGIAVAGSAAACGSEATGAAGSVTGITDGQVQAPQKRSILRVRQNGDPLQVTLKGGVLTDILGRIGYIADNHQLQFDAPPQAGAIYTAGFSACPDGTLALGDSNVFYACGSSDFTNLYDILVYPDNCREVKLFLV